MKINNLPYPELLRGSHAWEVNGADKFACADVTRRKMTVPLGSRRHGTRRHEMAHAKWTPRFYEVPSHIPAELVKALEEARVNLGMLRIGMPVVENKAKWPATQSVLDGIGVFLEDRESGEVHAMDEMAWEPICAGDPSMDMRRYAIEELLKAAGDEPVCHPKDLLRIADEIAKRWPDQMPRCPAGGGSKNVYADRQCDHAGKCPADAEDGDGAEGGEQSAMDTVLVDPEEAMKDFELEWVKSDSAKPGRLTVEHPALTVPTTRNDGKRGRGQWAVPEGTVVRAPHRWVIDQTIFAAKRKRRSGGTVLVDYSGSMGHLGPREITEICRAAPGNVTVAAYEGDPAGTGVLAILARGRYAFGGTWRKRWGGNVVDVPALAWLAKQPGPRLWLSDGMITGIHERTSDGLIRAALTIVRAGNIRRFHTWAPILKVLKGDAVLVEEAQGTVHGIPYSAALT